MKKISYVIITMIKITIRYPESKNMTKITAELKQKLIRQKRKIKILNSVLLFLMKK